MTTWALSVDAADDLERLVDFLLEDWPESAVATVDLIVEALAVLALHPKIGRPIEHGYH